MLINILKVFLGLCPGVEFAALYITSSRIVLCCRIHHILQDSLVLPFTSHPLGQSSAALYISSSRIVLCCRIHQILQDSLVLPFTSHPLGQSSAALYITSSRIVLCCCMHHILQDSLVLPYSSNPLGQSSAALCISSSRIVLCCRIHHIILSILSNKRTASCEVRNIGEHPRGQNIKLGNLIQVWNSKFDHLTSLLIRKEQ